jgi:hypothetical protein
LRYFARYGDQLPNNETAMQTIAALLIVASATIAITGLIAPRIPLFWAKAPSRLGALVLAFLIFLAWIVVASVDSSAPGTAAASNQGSADWRLAEEAIGSVTRSADWRDIRIEKAGDRSFRFTLYYARQPAGYAVVEADTKRIARAMLAALVKAGRRPTQEWISVFVWGEQDGLHGETGTNRVRVFGHTHYDWNYDQLEFEPFTK